MCILDRVRNPGVPDTNAADAASDSASLLDPLHLYAPVMPRGNDPTVTVRIVSVHFRAGNCDYSSDDTAKAEELYARKKVEN
jgi:hypothetical protein